LSDLGKCIIIVPDWGISILCIADNWSILLTVFVRRNTMVGDVAKYRW